MLQRGNENTVCNQISQVAQYRVERNAEEENITEESENIKDDVETLTSQELLVHGSTFLIMVLKSVIYALTRLLLIQRTNEAKFFRH